MATRPLVAALVTARTADLHGELFATLGVKSKRALWQSATGLYAVAYRAVTVRKAPRVEVWPETLALGEVLPTMPLWLADNLAVPVDLEASYEETSRVLKLDR